MILTDHVIDRYRIHYPDATPWDVEQALRYSEEVTHEEAAALSWGDPLSPRHQGEACRFRLHPTGRGLFVLKPDKGIEGRPLITITYLRLEQP